MFDTFPWSSVTIIHDFGIFYFSDFSANSSDISDITDISDISANISEKSK